MKYNKIFRILAMAIVLALLVVALPASPALAAYDYDIELDPDEGEIDDRIDIDGDDWPPSDDPDDVDPDIEEVDIYFSREEADEGDDIDSDVENYDRVKRGYDIDDDGEFSTSFRVPDELEDGDEDEDVVGGTYYVYVTMEGKDRIRAVAEFRVIAAEITLDTDEGSVGTKVEITGEGFAERDDITVEYDGDDVDIVSGDDETDRDGEFKDTTIIIPPSRAGDHTITVKDESGSEAEADFTVEPTGASLSPTKGNVGTALTLSGTGFIARNPVTIKYDDDEVTLEAPVTVATDGTFSATFNIPASIHGDHDITATDGTNTTTSTFTMESTAPPIPVPLLPTMDSKVSADAHFDWEDVTDPSLPITYTLQIATDDRFTTESILLEKTGRTESEYTLTREERLPTVKKEAPYYWRVRAIDAASNESGWPGTGSFYVGFTFGMPSWAIYTLLVLVALLLGVLGFWLGRRTTTS